MKDGDKTKEQLVRELEEMRRRVAEPEKAEAERGRAEEALRTGHSGRSRVQDGEFQRVSLEAGQRHRSARRMGRHCGSVLSGRETRER